SHSGFVMAIPGLSIPRRRQAQMGSNRTIVPARRRKAKGSSGSRRRGGHGRPLPLAAVNTGGGKVRHDQGTSPTERLPQPLQKVAGVLGGEQSPHRNRRGRTGR